MKLNQTFIGRIITSSGCKFVITAVSARKFRYRQILGNTDWRGSIHSGEARAWQHQINGRGEAARSYRSPMSFTLA